MKVGHNSQTNQTTRTQNQLAFSGHCLFHGQIDRFDRVGWHWLAYQNSTTLSLSAEERNFHPNYVTDARNFMQKVGMRISVGPNAKLQQDQNS